MRIKDRPHGSFRRLQRAQDRHRWIGGVLSRGIEPHGRHAEREGADDVGGPGVADHHGLIGSAAETIKRELENGRIRL
jgi:hypothetical protein